MEGFAPTAVAALLMVPLYGVPWIAGSSEGVSRLAILMVVAILAILFGMPMLAPDYAQMFWLVLGFSLVALWSVLVGAAARWLSFEQRPGPGRTVIAIIGACLAAMPVTSFFEWFYGGLAAGAA